MKERKLYLEESSGESIKKTSNNMVIFVDSFINFGSYHKIIFNQKIEDCRAHSSIFQAYYHGAYSSTVKIQH